jgi:cytochrome c553
MKKFFRILMYLVLIIAVVIIGLLVYVKNFLPNVGPAPDMFVELTQARIERGNYLANHVMLCMDCHSERDWSIWTGPPIPGTEGVGGDIFDQSMGLPGKFVARNITPFGIGDWTDGELFRLITTGVAKDGSPIFPIMPYPLYGQMDEEDIKSVIAYLRTLSPIENDLPPSKADFPMNFILNTIPKKASLTPMPSKDDRLAYGAYLATAGACTECHTKAEKGKIVGDYMAGGFEFAFPNGAVIRTSNITPDTETGIGNWTKEMFVQQFKQYTDSAYVPQNLQPDDFQTVMPWMMYAGMETDDLEALYDYLRTVPPSRNLVEKFTPTSN